MASINIKAAFAGSRLRRNLSVGALCTLTTAAASWLAIPLYLNILGYDQYGVWLALSAITAMIQLGGLGISPAVAKFVAEEMVHDDKSSVEPLVATAYLLMMTGTGIMAAIVALGTETACDWMGFDGPFRETARQLLPYVALVSAYAATVQVSVGAISGLGRADRAALSQTIGRVFTLVTSWVLLSLDFGLVGLLLGLALGLALTHLIAEFSSRSVSQFNWFHPRHLSRTEAARILRFGSGVLGGDLTRTLIHPLNKILLARFVGVGAVPILEVAWSASIHLRAVISASYQALLPDFSRAIAEGNTVRLKRLLRKSYQALLLLVPVFALVAIAATPLFQLWLGDTLKEGQVFTFRIMLLGSLLTMFGVPTYFFLLGAGRTSSMFTSQAIKSFTSLTLVGLAISLGALSTPIIAGAFAIASGVGTWWLAVQSRRCFNSLPTSSE